MLVLEGGAMKIKVNKQAVEVCDAKCATRKCLQVGQDHGPSVAGRGYTASAYKSRLVCLRRHLHGCPIGSVCGNQECRSRAVDEPGSVCTRCGSTTIARTARAGD